MSCFFPLSWHCRNVYHLLPGFPSDNSWLLRVPAGNNMWFAYCQVTPITCRDSPKWITLLSGLKKAYSIKYYIVNTLPAFMSKQHTVSNSRKREINLACVFFLRFCLWFAYFFWSFCMFLADRGCCRMNSASFLGVWPYPNEQGLSDL